nr:hypothetical protein [Rhodococcus jostii]
MALRVAQPSHSQSIRKARE